MAEQLKKGQKKTLEFEGQGVGGFLWDLVPSSDYKVIKVGNYTLIDNNPKHRPVGGGVTEFFEIESLTNLPFTVSAIYKRPWVEEYSKVEHFEFNGR